MNDRRNDEDLDVPQQRTEDPDPAHSDNDHVRDLESREVGAEEFPAQHTTAADRVGDVRDDATHTFGHHKDHQQDHDNDRASRTIDDEAQAVENRDDDDTFGDRPTEAIAPAGTITPADRVAAAEATEATEATDNDQDDDQDDDRAGHEQAVPQTTPQHVGPLFDQDPQQLQARWRELQSTFVDDPREAVERADGLVDEVVTTLTSTLTSRTTGLRDRWKNTEENDTEQLRLALREYRDVLERLLTLADGK